MSSVSVFRLPISRWIVCIRADIMAICFVTEISWLEVGVPSNCCIEFTCFSRSFSCNDENDCPAEPPPAPPLASEACERLSTLRRSWTNEVCRSVMRSFHFDMLSCAERSYASIFFRKSATSDFDPPLLSPPSTLLCEVMLRESSPPPAWTSLRRSSSSCRRSSISCRQDWFIMEENTESSEVMESRKLLRNSTDCE